MYGLRAIGVTCCDPGVMCEIAIRPLRMAKHKITTINLLEQTAAYQFEIDRLVITTDKRKRYPVHVGLGPVVEIIVPPAIRIS